MLFSLEALHAQQGDSLLLHFGEVDEPRSIVIDGGPIGTYKRALKPRLEALREERGGTLPIELLMISHIDEDHINGILDLSQALIDEPALRERYPVATLWHNTFEDVIEGAGGTIEVRDAAAAEVVPAGFEAVIASVNESRRLRDNARGLRWEENAGFEGFVMAADEGGKVDLGLEPLRLTVVGPRQTELDELRKKWNTELETLLQKDKLEVAATGADKSPTNLSSIVCVAELEGKRMLLTGDALGTKVLAELESAGFLPPGDGKMELDLLKVPHHGSAANVNVEFFERLPATHLVISANGEHDNPDIETLEMISKARPDDDFTLYLTESKFEKGLGPKIERFLKKEREENRRYDVVFGPPGEPALRIDLLDSPG